LSQAVGLLELGTPAAKFLLKSRSASYCQSN
jgi:hypothetical protein